MPLLQKKKNTECRGSYIIWVSGWLNRIGRNHHYVSKQVNPNLGNGMYPSSFYDPLILGMTSTDVTGACRVPDDSLTSTTATPTGIVRYPYPIWIRINWPAGIYSRCSACSQQGTKLSAPAGIDRRGTRITSPDWVDNRLVVRACIFI